MALLQPLSTKLTVWLLTVAVALIITFLLLAPYARKETVSGYLMPTAGTARIHAPQPGIVSAIHVAEGQGVEAEQALLGITTAQHAGDGADVNATILASLTAQRDLLAGQIEAEGERAGSERARLQALIQGVQAELSHLTAQTATQRERIRLAEVSVSSATRLTRTGYVSDLEYRRREEALLEHRQKLEAFGQEIAARGNQLTETRYSLEQLPITSADRIRTLRGELAATEQRIAEINGRRGYVIRAPVGGRVSALQATVGQTVDSTRLQLTIVPHDSMLRAELFVPTRAVGFVRVGQAVRFLYEAFPYQHFGTHGGRIVKISRTILTQADAAGPITLQEPAYRVTAELDRQHVDALGERVPLQPDMLLRADIILDRRSLMEWLLNPLVGARSLQQ